MFNINKIDTVYIAYRTTDLRKSIDGSVMIVKNELKIYPFESALFVFCNKQMNRIKYCILMRDSGYIITDLKMVGPMSIYWTQKVKFFYAALLANNSH